MSEPNNQLSIDILLIKQKLSELVLFESTSNKIEEIILEIKNILLKYYPAEINQIGNTITEYLIQQSSDNREKILTMFQEHAFLFSDIANFIESIKDSVETYTIQHALEEELSSAALGSAAPIISYDELTEEEKERKGFLISPEASSEEPISSIPQPQPLPEEVSKPIAGTEPKLEPSKTMIQKTAPEVPPPSPPQPVPAPSVAAAGPKPVMATETRQKSRQAISLSGSGKPSTPSSTPPGAKAATGSTARPSPSPVPPSLVPPSQPSPPPPPSTMTAETSQDKDSTKKLKKTEKEKPAAHVAGRRMPEKMESKELLYDNLSTDLDVSAFTEELESAEGKNRYLLIDYFDQMNPYQVYPISIIIAKHALTKAKRKQDLLTGESRSEVTGEMKLTGEAPLDVEVSYPGCIVTPSRQSISSQDDKVKILFFITPLAKGKMNGTIKISQENNLIFIMELKYKVTDQRIAKIISVIGVLVAAVPSLTKFLIGNDPNEQLKNLLPGIVAAASDYLIIEIITAIILFFVAGVFFFRYQGKRKSLTSLDF